MKTKLTLLFFSLLLFSTVYAQDTSKVKKPEPKMYYIETYDGTTITGTVVSENDKQIVMKSSLGEVTIKRDNIKTLKIISEDAFKDGTYWFENPHATRYVIGPSAIPLKQGEGYYQNLYLFAQSFNVGVTDHFSIGGGTEIASLLFAGSAPYAFFITPKVGYKVAPKIHVGGGALGLIIRDEGGLALGYGLTTFGSSDHNFTIGAGWGYNGFEGNFNTTPILTFSGMTRLAKRFALTTENWFVPDSNAEMGYMGIFSYGMRFMGERMAVDFGFFNNPEIAEDIKIGIPYIDFVVKFGGNRHK